MSDPQTTPTAEGTPDGDAAGDANTQPGGSSAAAGCGCGCSSDTATETDGTNTTSAKDTASAEDTTSAKDTTSAEETPSDDTTRDATSDTEDTTGDSDDPVAQLTAQLDERTADLQRLTAEYANFRRRTDRDRTAVIATAKTAAVTEFLPVVDDLELAEKHGDLTGPLKAIHDKLVAAFTKLGVEKFAAAGDTFDPEIHEAVQDLSTSDTKILGTVLRPGYRLGDKLMRTAMVIIADAE